MDAVNGRRPQDEALGPQGRKAIWGAFLGFFIDNFDIFLPVVVLAPATAYFFSPEISESTAVILSAVVLVVTLIGRPLGALIFGPLADRIGRKRMALTSVTGFGVATLLIALLPGYEQWGLAAVIILILLRLVDGVFLGGEYSAASPLAMEYCPQKKRGFYGALIQSAAAIAFATISLVALAVLSLVPAGGLDSPYVQWGWRIPFFIGTAMAFAFVFYYYFSVDESELWRRSAKTEAPLRTLFSGDNLRNFLQVFVLMSGFWLSLLTAIAVLPGLLGSAIGASSSIVALSTAVATLAVALAYIVGGVVSQRIGRRIFLMLAGGISAIAGTFFYYLLLSTVPENPFVVIFLTAVITVVVVWPGGLATVYINERFHTSVRGSGFGLGYSLAIILPSLYAFYQEGLASFMPFKYTVLVLVVIGGLLILGGAAWGPETKDVDFSASSSNPQEGEPKA